MRITESQSGVCVVRRAVWGLLVSFAAWFLAPCGANAQVITTNIDGLSNPDFAAVDPVTNNVFVGESGGFLLVVNGATNGGPTIYIGSNASAAAVNPLTGKVYLAQQGMVTVLDEGSWATAQITTGGNSAGIAVNAVTNKIYVTDSSDNEVWIIDGATNAVTSVAVGTLPQNIAVNPVTNKIYVANLGNCCSTPGTITVIDGATNATTTLGGTGNPTGIAVNPVTNKIYVNNIVNGSFSLDNVTVIDGATNAVTSVSSGGTGWGIAVNPVTNKVYAVAGTNSIAVIDGATNSVATVPVGFDPVTICLDALTNQIYVANYNNGTSGGSITVINGATNSTTTLIVGAGPSNPAVNPVTHKVYVPNVNDGTLSVIDGATNATATVPTGTNPGGLDINPVTNKIYVPNFSSNNVTVIDGATNATTTVPAGTNPVNVAVNPVTNKIYVTNLNTNSSASSTVTVIDGATNATTTIPAGVNPFDVAVNSLTNQIYVTNKGSNTVTAINGATNSTTTIPVGAFPQYLAVNQATNKIYVVNYLGKTVTVIDGATNATSTVPVGNGPGEIAVNSVTNQIYVANAGDNTVTAIDGGTNTPTTIPLGGGISPTALAINPVTNKVYVSNYGSASVTVIDCVTLATTQISVGNEAFAATVNPVTNKIFVAYSNGNTVTEIDGATFRTTTITTGQFPSYMAINGFTNRLYVSNYSNSSNSVTVLSDVNVQAIPLATAIKPLTNNQASVNSPATFTFTTADTYSPGATTPLSVYYQLDTWQGQWHAASGSGNSFSALLAALSPGTHILYAYAVDGQIASADGMSSPVIGNVAAYEFTVVAESTATTLTSSGNPSAQGASVTFTATVAEVAPGTAVPTGTVTFMDGSTALGTATLDASGTASFSTSSLAGGSHSITAVYGGDVNNLASASSVVTQQILYATTVSLGSSVNPSADGASVTFGATVTNSVAGPVTGQVFFYDGTGEFGAALLGNTGNPQVATLAYSSLKPGNHSITAVYQGDTNDAMSTSLVLTQTVQAISTTTTVTSTQSPIAYGQPVGFVAVVTNTSGPAGAPTGAIQFVVDGVNFGSPVALTASNSNTSTATSQNTFTLSVAGSPHTVTANYLNADGTFSNSNATLAGGQTVTATATTTTIFSNANPSVFGQRVSFFATVTASSNGPASVPTGAVQFVVDGVNFGSPVAVIGGSGGNSAGANSQTIATLSVSGSPHAVAAIYVNADGNFANSNATLAGGQSVTPAATTTTLGSSANPATYSQSVILTATVAAVAPGSGTPTGTVTFLDSGAAIGTGTLSAGSASFTTSALGAGAHSITAAYGGDSNDAASTSAALGQNIQQTATTTALSASASSALANSPVTFTATVATSSGKSIPTGSVSFKDGTTVLGSGTLTAGVANYSTSALAIGSHNISAVYGGDTNDVSSTSPAVVELVDENTAVALASSANPVLAGTALTITATVTGSASGTPTGTVTFKDGAAVLSSATLNGSGIATFGTSTLAPGQHSITASYGGDTDDLPANSVVLTQTVQQNTSTAITSTANPSYSGNSVTFTATVTAVVSGTPTGTVTFKDGSTTLGTATLNGSGVVSYSTVTLTAASHSITAVYGGDAINLASTSTTLSQTVNAANFNISANPATQTIADGQTATYTLTVTPQGAFTSPISFSCTGLPALAMCEFSQPSLTPNTTAATTTLTVATVGKTAMTTPPSNMTLRNWPQYFFGAFAGLFARVSFLLVYADSQRARQLGRAAALAGFLLLIAGSMAACAGGSRPVTPMGTSQVQVNASATENGSSVNHSATLTLTIQ